MNTFGDKQTSASLPTANACRSMAWWRMRILPAGWPRLATRDDQGGGRWWRARHARSGHIFLLKGFHTAHRRRRPSVMAGCTSRNSSRTHYELPDLGDTKGNIIHLGERDCSIQRRNQKLIEETPSPLMAEMPDLRQEMGEAALHAHESGYVNAGTVDSWPMTRATIIS